MSGGHFDYKQFEISRMATDIQVLILNNKSTELDEYGDPMGRDYPPEVIAKFHEAVRVLKTAFAYAHCIDYLVCGDTGNDSFLEHLDRELANLEAKP